MAEVAGLVVGTLALVSTFRDCVELLSRISTARAFDRDYRRLITKLDIEKTLLLQWAERLHLLDGHDNDKDNNKDDDGSRSRKQLHDSRLDDPHTHELVARVLGEIREMLADAHGLRHKYGLEETDDRLVPTIAGKQVALLSNVRRDHAMNMLMCTRNPPLLERGYPVKLLKVKWAIHDKDKFAALVSELGHFCSRLNRLVPPLHERQVDSMMLDDVQQVSHSPFLRLMQEALRSTEAMSSTFADQSLRKMATEQLILRQLWFRGMRGRIDGVDGAHFRTLGWLLQPPSEGVPWNDLAEWLRAGDGTYWIAGKPGSGKSTLMKYLYSQDRVNSLFQEWAGNPRTAENATGDGGTEGITIAAFFFWNLGNKLQKSLEGMMRTILHDVLTDDYSLMPELLPDMWREAHEPQGLEIALPSVVEMRSAFKILVNMRETSRKYLFFIDGLDELDGDHRDAAEFLKMLAGSKSIKIIVSSREHSIFFDVFGKLPTLRVQDLTHNDIAAYVHDVVGQHDRMRELLERHPQYASNLLSKLIGKASGVFLWVILSCRSLLDGFAAYDSLEELDRRIDELPPELENLFRQILGKIEARYQSQAAKLLRISFENMKLPRVGWEPGDMPAIGLARTVEADMRIGDGSRAQLQDDEVAPLLNVLQGRLRSRCCGLIEIQGYEDPVSASIRFMHRTVFEFLEATPEIWGSASMCVQDEDFHAFGALADIDLSFAAAANGLITNKRKFRLLTSACVWYSKMENEVKGKSYPVLLLEFKKLARRVAAEYRSRSLMHTCKYVVKFLIRHGIDPGEGEEGEEEEERARLRELAAEMRYMTVTRQRENGGDNGWGSVTPVKPTGTSRIKGSTEHSAWAFERQQVDERDKLLSGGKQATANVTSIEAIEGRKGEHRPVPPKLGSSLSDPG